MLLTDDRRISDRALAGGATLLTAAALFLLACGVFAIVQAASGRFLPHDAVYLGMSAADLCAIDECRVLSFMIHDRISFGGVLVAIGVLYLWLARQALRQGAAWAWWTLALSGTAGFLSFLTYIGYGYLDTWHGLGTLALLPIFAAGLVRTRRLRRSRLESQPLDLRSTAGRGRALLLLTGVGIAAAGLTIATVGTTTVFVPQDLAFMGMTRDALTGVHPHLVPLIAHDRAGFGGALVSFAVAMVGCVRYARLSRALWQSLTVAGAAGFGAAIGIHPIIGYTSVSHLAPAVLGAVVFALGLVLAMRDLRS